MTIKKYKTVGEVPECSFICFKINEDDDEQNYLKSMHGKEFSHITEICYRTKAVLNSTEIYDLKESAVNRDVFNLTGDQIWN